jgi:hypothetical protein
VLVLCTLSQAHRIVSSFALEYLNRTAPSVGGLSRFCLFSASFFAKPAIEVINPDLPLVVLQFFVFALSVRCVY